MTKGIEVRANSIRFRFVTSDGTVHKQTLNHEGKPLRPTPPNVKFANRLAQEILDRIDAGTFSLVEYFPASGNVGEVTTVATILDTWLAGLRVKASTRTGYETCVRFWKAAIGDKPLRALKHSDVKKALADAPQLTGKTINNRTSVLSSALDLAVFDKLLPANPMAGLERAKHQKKPIAPFTADESERILAGAAKRYPGPLANMLEFWFRSGMRTSEVFGLKWSSVDMVAATALIHEALVAGVEEDSTKTGKTREVRLDSRALAALQRQKAFTFMAGSHVFVDPFTGKPWANTQAFSRRVWGPLMKSVGVPYRRPYTIRHARATAMMMAGVKPGFAAGQLGHDVKVYLDVYAKWQTGTDDAAEMAKLEAPKISPEFPRESGRSV